LSAMTRRKTWTYFLPFLHLCACFISMLGHLIPTLQYLGIVWAGTMGRQEIVVDSGKRVGNLFHVPVSTTVGDCWLRLRISA
jgi:hypothetical protein